MTPAAAKASYARQIARHGESMTLTRAAVSETVRGRILRTKFDAITDTVQQIAPQAIILADDLTTLVPQKGDVLTVGADGFMVDDVDGLTRRVSGETIAYTLTLIGA